MKVMVHWRQEGDTVVDCKSLEDGIDQAAELVARWDITERTDTSLSDPEMLGATIVGPS